jgi:DNA-binding MarR family transcriptional regulator
MRALARAWACDASNVTWMVDRLESRGLVERRMLPSDRRVKTVALTPLGASTKAELFTRLNEPPADFPPWTGHPAGAARRAGASAGVAVRHRLARAPARRRGTASPARLRRAAVLGLRRRCPP